MEFTQEDLDKLKSAYVLGATTVKYGDKEITYRSLKDMERIIERLEGSLGISNNIVRRKITEYDRGYE
jgi:hypothetical protein